MDEEQSLKSNNDTADGLFKIGNILSIQTIEKAAEQSQEKYLNENIQKIRDNVAFHEELLTVQNSNILDHECLEQLDYIFNQSLLSNRAQFELALNDKIKIKRNNIEKLSRDFAEQRNVMSSKYEQLREHKLTRCELHKKIMGEEKALQNDKDLLKSLADTVLIKKLDIKRTNDKNKRLEHEVIIKFATLMQVRNREIKLKKQLVKNAEIKKRLDEDIKELQWHHMGKEMRNYEPQIASDIGNEIAQKLLLVASLPRASNNAVKLVSAESQSSELHITTVNSVCTQKNVKYSKSEYKPNTSFSKMNMSFTNNIFYSNLPLLKNAKSANMAATTSKYFQSSRTYLKSFGKKYPLATDNSLTKLGDNYNAVSRSDDKSNKEFDFDYEHAPNNPGKRVKFSAELKEAYVSDTPQKAIQQPNTATKIEVINVIREDIVRSNIQSKTTSPTAVSQENIKNAEIIEDEMEVYRDEYGNNFTYLDSNSQYVGQDEDVTPIIEPAETGDSNKYSMEEMDMEGQDMFSFGRK